MNEPARPVAGDDARAEVRRDELLLGRVGVEHDVLQAAGGGDYGVRAEVRRDELLLGRVGVERRQVLTVRRRRLGAAGGGGDHGMEHGRRWMETEFPNRREWVMELPVSGWIRNLYTDQSRVCLLRSDSEFISCWDLGTRWNEFWRRGSFRIPTPYLSSKFA